MKEPKWKKALDRIRRSGWYFDGKKYYPVFDDAILVEQEIQRLQFWERRHKAGEK